MLTKESVGQISSSIESFSLGSTSSSEDLTITSYKADSDSSSSLGVSLTVLLESFSVLVTCEIFDGRLVRHFVYVLRDQSELLVKSSGSRSS
jgi:hypothetical protein